MSEETNQNNNGEQGQTPEMTQEEMERRAAQWFGGKPEGGDVVDHITQPAFKVEDISQMLGQMLKSGGGLIMGSSRGRRVSSVTEFHVSGFSVEPTDCYTKLIEEGAKHVCCPTHMLHGIGAAIYGIFANAYSHGLHDGACQHGGRCGEIDPEEMAVINGQAEALARHFHGISQGKMAASRTAAIIGMALVHFGHIDMHEEMRSRQTDYSEQVLSANDERAAEILNLSGLERVKEALAKFEKLQQECRNYGAADTEPDHIFQARVWDAITGNPRPVPESAEQWDLYDGEGRDEAAYRLTTGLNEVLGVLADLRVREVPDVKDYLQRICWRVAP